MIQAETVVIIPTYNEADNINDLVAQLLELPGNISVLVVDDNSPDGTGDIADEWRARIVVLAPEYRHKKNGSLSQAQEVAKEILENRGNSPRLYRNTGGTTVRCAFQPSPAIG